MEYVAPLLSIVALYAGFFLFVHFLFPDGVPAPNVDSATTTVERVIWPEVSGAGALFHCNDTKALRAEFSERTVRITLSDGRSMILGRISAIQGQPVLGSDSAYANPDGSFVFRSHNHQLSLEEYGQFSYAGCVLASEDASISP